MKNRKFKNQLFLVITLVSGLLYSCEEIPLEDSLQTLDIPSDLSGIISSEESSFKDKFGYIETFFGFSPVPKWNNPRIIRLNEEDANIFIDCTTNGSEIGNKFVFVISKRGDDYFSYIKMLPEKDKTIHRLVASVEEEKVYLELFTKQADGGTISQQMGYLTSGNGQPETRSNCFNQSIDIMVGIRSYGDGQYSPIYKTMLKLVCIDSEGGGGGNWVPVEQPDYTGVIPPYKSPTGDGGSSGSGGNNGSGGSSGSGGGSGSGGSSGTGGGSGSGGGSGLGGGNGGGGNGGGNNGPIPSWGVPDSDDPGGIDFLPPPPNRKWIEDPYADARKRFAEEIYQLLDEVRKYTPIPDGTETNLVENCASNARVKDGNIEVCYRFYTDEHLTNKDRVSILYHEVLHIKNHDTDKEPEVYKMKTAITLQNVPSEFKQYIMDHVIMIGYLPSDQWEQEYLREITFESIYPPEYYKNEIEAYENEIQTITGVSAYYNTQRRYKLWEHTQLYDISKNYYGK